MKTMIDLLKTVKRALTRAAIRLCNGLFRLLPVQNRVLFYTIRADGRLLENIDCVFRACNCKKVVFAHMLPHSFLLSLRARRLMLTSRVIVTDDYLKYCRDTTLRNGQKLVQLWHAPGAFKCFGLDAPSRLSETQERATHAQYTDVCVSSETVRRYYAQAFGVPLSVVKPLGTPRTDALLDRDARRAAKDALLERCPCLKGKTVYLYAPTFREQNGQLVPFDPQLDFAALEETLRDDELLVITRHPVMKTPFFQDGRYRRIVDLTNEPTDMLLCAADVLITDYSSVLFDAALCGVPCVFWCPDRHAYERGFYLDFDNDLPGEIVETAGDLPDAIRRAAANRNNEKLRAFCSAQMSACDGGATKRIAARICSYLNA